MAEDSPPLQSSVDSLTKDNSPVNEIQTWIQVTSVFDQSGEVTMISRPIEKPPCEGTDSGIEANGNCNYQRAHSSNSQDLESITSSRSCDSSIISCSYEDNFNLIVERNLQLHSCDDTGSESSSITRPTSKNSKRISTKKKVDDSKNKLKPPTNKRNASLRVKSLDRLARGDQAKNNTTPNCDNLKRENKSCPRKIVQTYDGRWPSVCSKPAPLMPKRRSMMKKSDTKIVEKYATLPRKKKDTLAVPNQTPNVRKQRIRIYHETGSQTAVTSDDVDRAFASLPMILSSPQDVEKVDKDEQVDLVDFEMMQRQIQKLTEKCGEQSDKLAETEMLLEAERVENREIRGRIANILGEEESSKGEPNPVNSLITILETRFQKTTQTIVRQKEKITKLQQHCKILQNQECEYSELQDFLQQEKNVLTESLNEADKEIDKYNRLLTDTENRLRAKEEECRNLTKVNQQRREQNFILQGRMGALEAKSRELLVYQGSSASGTSIALSALTRRLEGLVEELVTSYNISDQELEDVIFHNEAYRTSTPEASPEKSRKFLRGSSFLSAVINALKNATAQTPFVAITGANEMLDSETEPFLMMEHVLEDVVVADGHSHNMISSRHGLINRDLSKSYPPASTDSKLTSSLVDEVITVDNLVTRLLKVIRIIQLESDDWIDDQNKDNQI